MADHPSIATMPAALIAPGGAHYHAELACLGLPREGRLAVTREQAEQFHAPCPACWTPAGYIVRGAS